MSFVVFLRGVNVGGHRKFQPSVLASEMTALSVVNVGAAGTFVVRKTVSQAKLRAEFVRHLPFDAEIMICPASEVMNLLKHEELAVEGDQKDMKKYVTILAKRPKVLPGLPIRQPDGEDWQVKVVALTGRFALSLWRRMGPRLIYPNEVIEKKLGVPATTRNWNTIEVIAEHLRK